MSTDPDLICKIYCLRVKIHQYEDYVNIQPLVTKRGTRIEVSQKSYYEHIILQSLLEHENTLYEADL